MNLNILTVVFTFCLLSLSQGAEARFQYDDLSDEKQAQFLDLAYQLRCPTCTGLSVLESDADFSVQIKEAVKKQVQEGKSPDQIMEFFTDRYGLWILREPPKEGFHLIAWLGPGLLFVVGAMSLWLFVWRRQKTVSNFGQRTTSAILEQMDEELEKMRTQTS